jgi:tetratricopeptide (TPR) repeat protein
MRPTPSGASIRTEEKLSSESHAGFLKPGVKIFIIAFLAILIYCGTVSSPFIFDDRRAIIDNQVVRNFAYFFDPAASAGASAESSNIDFPKTRYIGYLSFAVNYHLNGLNVAGYHIINILIHVINGVLVYWLVLLIAGTPFFRDRTDCIFNSQTVAFFSSLLFVCHPVQTQAVTYIVQRLASLATMFYLLSIAFYIKARLSATGPASSYIYAGSLLAAIAAMFTKEISFTLPFVIILCEIFFFQEKTRAVLLRLIPFLLLLLIIPLTVVTAADQNNVEQAVNIANRRGLSGVDYFLTQITVIITYIRLLFYPSGQNFDYDYPLHDSFLSYPVLLSASGLCATVAIGVYLYFRLRRPSDISAYLRLISFGIFWFFTTLSVESSFIPLSDVIFEHRLYLPSAGFCMATVASVLAIGHKAGLKFKPAGNIVISFLIVGIFILSIAAYKRNSIWDTEISLWEDTVSKSPKKARPHYHLGMAYLNANRTEDAIRELTIVTQTEDFARLHYNLGVALFKTGFYDEAIASYKKALALEPSHFDSHLNLAVSYALIKQPAEAEREFKAAVLLRPESIQAHLNMAAFYENSGNTTKAEEEYRHLMKYQPKIPDKINNNGVAYYKKGKIETAIKKYQLALKLDPNLVQAHYNLALAYIKANKPDMAISELKTTLKLKSDLAMAHYSLAIIYKAKKEIKLAMQELETTLKIEPDHSDAQKDLAELRNTR